MFSSRVRDPRGNTWTVRLRIIPERKGIGLRERFSKPFRKRKNDGEDRWYDYLDLPIDIDHPMVMVAFAVIFLALIFLGVPLLLAAIDLAWLLLVLLGVIVSFVILRRPITVATSCNGRTHNFKIRGIRTAFQLKAKLVDDIMRGDAPFRV